MRSLSLVFYFIHSQNHQHHQRWLELSSEEFYFVVVVVFFSRREYHIFKLEKAKSITIQWFFKSIQSGCCHFSCFEKSPEKNFCFFPIRQLIYANGNRIGYLSSKWYIQFKKKNKTPKKR